METLWQDLRFGIRTLLRAPGFTFTAILTLALGIGANASIFSVVNATLLRPLPYKDPAKLLAIRPDFRGVKKLPGLGGAEISDLHEQSHLIQDIGVIAPVNASLTGEKMQQIRAASITESFLPLLGISPLLGRNISMKLDNGPEFVSGVLISYELWKNTFNGDPSIIGRSIEVNNFNAAVVGVMPRDFRLYFGPDTNVPAKLDLFFPADLGPNSLGKSRIYHDIVTVARLKEDATLGQAQQEVDGIAQRLIEQYPKAYENSGLKFNLVPLHNDVVQEIRPSILALLGAVAFVLLIACSNVANMLLARGKAREKELVIRAALGAGRHRIIRQLVTESFLLSVIGGGAGLLLASWGINFLLYLRPAKLPRQDDISIDGTVLIYTLAISVLAGLIFGLVPAWKTTKFNINETLKEGVRTSSVAGGERLRSGLVIVQVALSLVLFVGTGLMIRTFAKLHQVNLGFNADNVLTLEANLVPMRVNERTTRVAYFRTAMEKMKSMPGVESVGGINPLPLGGQQMLNSYAPAESPSEIKAASHFTTMPGYFETMQIRLVAGRFFNDHDNDQYSPIAIIDKNFADANWPGQDAIGRKIVLSATSKRPNPVEVVGVVDHVKMEGLQEDNRPQVYEPYASAAYDGMTLAVRTKGNPLSLATVAKKEIESIPDGRAVSAIKMMDEYVSDAMASTSFALFLLGILAFVALVLCAVGLYGVIAYSVNQRVAEIGIRMSLGAQPSDILKMIIGKGLILTLIGVAMGIAGSFFITRLMAGMLYQVKTTDPVTFIGVSVLLMIIGLLACYIPARRATRVDPMTALR